MTSETSKQIITIHILLNMSRSKGIQAMKFGLLITQGDKFFFHA